MYIVHTEKMGGISHPKPKQLTATRVRTPETLTRAYIRLQSQLATSSGTQTPTQIHTYKRAFPPTVPPTLTHTHMPKFDAKIKKLHCMYTLAEEIVMIGYVIPRYGSRKNYVSNNNTKNPYKD